MGSSDPALMIGDFVVVTFSLIYDEIYLVATSFRPLSIAS